MRQIGAERLFALHQKIAWGAGPPSGFHRSRRRNGRTQSANGQRARPVLPPLCSDGRYGRHGPTELVADPTIDRKSTRLNSSHTVISYAVFCLKKKKTTTKIQNATKENS